MKRTFILLLALVMTLGISLVATMPVAADPGTTYYVSTTGSDETGDGSYSDPWGTIQHAVDQVSSGDTIMVAPGEYTGAIVGKNVTISGLGPGDTVITAGVCYNSGCSPAYETAFRLDAGADGAQITDFVVNNNAGANFFFAVFSRAIDDVTIDSLEINDTVQGISNWGGSGWEITNNTITDTVAAGGGGIGIFLGAMPPGYRICSDNLVQYNTIDASATAVDYSCPGICVALDLRGSAYGALNGTEDVSGNQILDNTVIGNGGENSAGVEMGVIGLEGDPDKIAATMGMVDNNTVHDNVMEEVDLGLYFYVASNLTITENDMTDCGYGMYTADAIEDVTVEDNTFTDNTIQVEDISEDLDLDLILDNNTFDRAVVVRGSPIKVPVIFSSIQDAIDAASTGDTINVADGTYTEQLTISNKGLTITGESESGVIVQAGTTAPGSSNVFTIDAAGKDITIQNMTIRNGLYGIRSSAGDVNVLHCTFYHNGYDGSPYAYPPTQGNATAMWASGHTTNGGTMRIQNSGSSEIAYCTAYENARGIRFQDGDNGNIHDCVSYNNIESGIYLASNTYTGTAGCTNTVIRDCESYGNMNSGILVIGGRNITVESNDVHDNWNTGIMLWHPSEVVIENNTITHNNIYSFNGVGNDGDDEGGIWMVGATAMTPLSFVCKILNNTISDTQVGGLSEKVGINVGDVYDSSIVIEHNTFSDHDIDVWVQYEAATTVVNYNNFGTDYGIKNDDTSAILDGQFNWWGDASGPYNATTNPSGTGDSVSDNVDYSPWWGANYIGVAHPWEWYTNDSIQEAVDAASAGDTVNVMAGMYVEDLVIPAGKDGLELKGNGCNVTTIKGVATSAGTPVYNIRFDEFDGVSGVKIHGFTIESPDVPTNHFASGMVLNGQDIEIYDNCFVSKGAASAVDNYCVAIQTWRWSAAPDSDLTGLKIYDNTFSSEGDLWVYQGVFVNRDGEDFGDVTVSGNNFSGNVHMGIAYEGNNAVISDNEMTSTYEGVGIAIMDWAELEQNDVDVDGNELQGFNYGVLVGRGAQVMTNITVANNVFSDNRYQVRDRVDTLNMEDVLAGNTFDRAVVVRGSGIKVPTIFSSIQDAIDAAVAGDTVDVAAGTYTHTAQIVIDKDLTIIGEDKGTTIIEPDPGFTDSYLFRINDGEVNLSNLTFDGKSNLYGGVRYGAPGTGTLSNNIFKNVVAPGYMGFGVVVFADNVTVSNNILTNIGRVGVWVGADNALVTGNTYTGKGAIDCLDYGIEVEMGGVATITDNTITNCLGVASSDNSTSAAILVTTYFGAGTEATITGNTLTGNTGGIAVGYDGSDTSTVVAHYNNISGNTDYGIDTTAPSVDATANWWGAATGPYHDPLNLGGEGNAVSDNVLFEPWYGDEEMTTLVGHSTYEFVYDVPDVIVACEDTEIPVTFQTDELGVVGYYGVRFKFNATGPGDVIFKATDSEEFEHTFVNSGFWGPLAGFNLTADYSATTDWSLNFSEPGEYNITFSLIEAPDGDVVAGIEGSEDVTVRAVDILDYYRYLHTPYDEVTTLDLLAAADDWIVNAVPPGFDAPITTLQLLALADEWLSS